MGIDSMQLVTGSLMVVFVLRYCSGAQLQDNYLFCLICEAGQSLGHIGCYTVR